MGIPISAFKFLLQEHCRRPFVGGVLQLGRQDISFTLKEAQQAARTLGFELPQLTPTLSRKAENAARGFLSDETVFRLAGFHEVWAADKSNYEEADFLFDLNDAGAGAGLQRRFDVVFDGGTLEHVFHFPNALANIHELLPVGGRVIHISPSSNHVDHGFYMFSPTLFYDFYSANAYDVNAIKFFRHTRRIGIDPWEIMNYTPGCLSNISFGGLDGSLYGIICVATKTPSSSANRIPQQAMYVERWKASAGDAKAGKRIPWYRPVKVTYDRIRRRIWRGSKPKGTRPLQKLGLHVDDEL